MSLATNQTPIDTAATDALNVNDRKAGEFIRTRDPKGHTDKPSGTVEHTTTLDSILGCDDGYHAGTAVLTDIIRDWFYTHVGYRCRLTTKENLYTLATDTAKLREKLNGTQKRQINIVAVYSLASGKLIGFKLEFCPHQWADLDRVDIRKAIQK